MTGPPGGPLRIVVVDDQATVREGLAVMLDLLPDIQVVATAADGLQALEEVTRHSPDAVLMDLHMPVMDGVEATRRLQAEHPHVAIVVLTTYVDDQTVLKALGAGARSYLTKDSERTDIARALRSAVSGLSVLHPQAHQALLAAAQNGRTGEQSDQRSDELTDREKEVLRLIARGMTNPEIAQSLFLSANTVKTHINRIFAKTNSRDRVAAIRYAQGRGLT